MNQNFLEKIKHAKLVRNDPDRDWAVLFFTLLLLVVCAFAWSTHFFFGIMSDVEATRAYKDSAVGNLLGGTEMELKAVIGTYEEKRAEGDKINSSYPVLGDPSVF